MGSMSSGTNSSVRFVGSQELYGITQTGKRRAGAPVHADTPYVLFSSLHSLTNTVEIQRVSYKGFAIWSYTLSTFSCSQYVRVEMVSCAQTSKL